MGKYIVEVDVERFTRGKVEYTDDPADLNRYERALLKQMIDEAEGEVEMDLMPRYDVPFKGRDEAPFSKLPDTTKNVIRALCRLKATMKVLESRHGRGNAVDAGKYTDTLKLQYQNMLDDRILKKRDGAIDTMQWQYPPLPNLKVAYFNTADDGFFGHVLSVNPSGEQGAYAAEQVNDPSSSFYNIAAKKDWEQL